MDSPFVGTSGKYNELRLRTANYSGTAYDPILEVTYVTNTTPPPSPTVIQDISYTYDANGNITQIIDTSGTDTAKTAIYTYDALNRLTSASATGSANGDNYVRSYAYDAIGNIANASDRGTYTYAGTGYANPHAVTSVGGIIYTYDNNGNMAGDGTWTNTWNYQNRLIQSQKTGAAVSYEYDHEGQRTKYGNGTKTTRYANKYFNTDGAIPTKHIFAGEEVIATVEGTNLNYIHTDHLTGSNAVTNSTAGMIQLLDYYPYGSLRIDWRYGSFDEQRKFAGHEYDRDTDLSYMEARYYNGSIGRFISQDPAFLAVGDDKKLKEITNLERETYLANPQYLNSYSYATNNPLKYTDPQGEFIDTLADLAFIGYDLYKVGQAWYQGESVKGELGNLGLDVGGALIPGVTGLGMTNRVVRGVDKIQDGAKIIHRTKQFDAVAQQQKMLEGVENLKAINTIKDVFRKSDTIPGGTMGALRNEILTGKSTEGIFHTNKAENTINRIQNIFKTENLKQAESDRLQSISNSLKSLLKNVK